MVNGSRKVLPLLLALAVLVVASGAEAWVVFPVAGLHPGQSALVAEQIFPNPNFGGLLDYEFLVANTGTVPLDGFFLGVPGGAGGLALALAGGLRYADAFGGADGPFPAVVPGGVLNAPIADYYGATNPFSPALFKFWGFEQFNNPANGAYVVRWFAAGVPPMPPGFFTRFDLISAFGPVPGGGAVDPPDFNLTFIGIDGIDPILGDINTVIDSPVVTSCPSVTEGGCSSSNPAEFSRFTALAVPEPALVTLLGVGLASLAGLSVRRRR
jgi:hypothetical protein